MGTNQLVRLGALALVGVLAVPGLFGATYTYTKITDDAPGSTLGAFTSFLGPFLINSSGAVAFTAKSGDVGEVGVYTGSASGINTVYVGGLNLNSPLVFAATGFNDSGTVVYLTEARAVYTATAGGTPFMVSAPTSTGNSAIFPGINNAGTVAYGADELNNSILTRTGTADAQTLVSNTALPGSNALTAPTLTGLSINNSGTVAFYALDVASGASCRCGIYTAGPGAPTPVAPLQENLSSGTVPQLNENGAIAFLGTYQSVKGVFVASNGQIAAAVDLGTQVVSLGAANNVSLNSQGQVAYWAKFGISPFVEGIFTGPDKVADKVIGTGDPLFGSVVSSIAEPQVAGRFLNDNGQVAFSYKLSNGLSGVAVATPVASGTPPPSLAANGIVNGASFDGEAPTAPGAIVSIFGSNFISQLTVPSGDPLPTSLQGVSVTFNGTEAPLFFVAPGQINAQVPYEVSGSSATVQVTTPAGTSNTETINLAPASPAIFTTSQNGSGQAVVVFANTTTIVGPVKTGTDWRPAKTGDTITIYTNGLGAVTPPINDGWNSCDQSVCKPDFSNLTLRNTTVRPVVTIGGVTVADNLILFSGLTPAFAGLYQINLTIPDGITASNQVPVVIQMGATSSPMNVSIAMQ
jgi:uncharacterized protein (TIGR03437 family)